MLTVHSVTNDQRILDLPHSDYRRGRSGFTNIIPTTTGAAAAVGLVLPQLKGKLDGIAMRVPTITGSVVYLSCQLDKKVTAEEINSAIKKHSSETLAYCEKEIVSSDIIGETHGSIFDSKLTKVMDNNDINVKNKKVLLRVDFNVPIKNNVITDDNRIVAALPTVNYLIDQDAKVILFSHLGRVESEEDKQSASLFPVAKALEKLLGKKVIFIDQTRGSKLESAIDDMNFGDVLLFENTRFEDVPGKKESKNDPELELEMLSQGIDNPTKPLVAILGGAKVSDKIAVIENLIPKSDQILIGGAMAYTFLKAQGINIGSSRVETDKLELATELLKKANGKIVLPIDHAVTAKFEDVKPNYTLDANIPDGSMGLDIGPKTMEKYANILKTAKTVV
uniref:Phosphoglycerate kinase n=1 Tax=Biomphalaria glabrata TaxID=6526 RepID=A0A2C9MA09_BIOGL